MQCQECTTANFRPKCLDLPLTSYKLFKYTFTWGIAYYSDLWSHLRMDDWLGKSFRPGLICNEGLLRMTGTLSIWLERPLLGRLSVWISVCDCGCLWMSFGNVPMRFRWWVHLGFSDDLWTSRVYETQALGAIKSTVRSRKTPHLHVEAKRQTDRQIEYQQRGTVIEVANARII